MEHKLTNVKIYLKDLEIAGKTSKQTETLLEHNIPCRLARHFKEQ